MNLHDDREAFDELLIGAANELAIPTDIIEKDYYVTIALKKLSEKLEDMVFKGGTSLTKCYQLLNRFSEDIDISYTAESGIPGEARKKQLKKAVVAVMDELGFPITNIDKTRSRRNYNCYRASYPSIYEKTNYLKPELVVETYVALLPFPTTRRMVDNYIYRFLKKIDRLDLAEIYGLLPFEITTQTIERTLVDKVFALCDYYLQGKISGHSRHLYDIYKLSPLIKFDEKFLILVGEVRKHRAQMSICPSAMPGVHVPEIITQFCDNDFYEKDYEDITSYFSADYVSYKDTIAKMREIATGSLFIE